MTNRPDLSSIVGAAAARRKLGLRHDLGETGWIFWELRTLNRHRAVGYWKDNRRLTDARVLESEIRDAMSHNFKRSWWRGFAYGVVRELDAITWSPDDLKWLVDIHENPKGVLQWVILIANDRRSATGVHTWMEVYLSPVYREILQALTTAGYDVATAVRGKDGLLKFLTGVSNISGTSFPDFRGRS